jgi:hypothetical protein
MPDRTGGTIDDGRLASPYPLSGRWVVKPCVHSRKSTQPARHQLRHTGPVSRRDTDQIPNTELTGRADHG